MSPGLYPTKKEHGKVVPTWNYTMVQVRGTPRLIDDPKWVLQQIETMTDEQESRLPNPWKVSDASQDYIDGMLTRIIGLEIAITSIEGKFKQSQNQPEVNRIEVEKHFKNMENK